MQVVESSEDKFHETPQQRACGSGSKNGK